MHKNVIKITSVKNSIKSHVFGFSLGLVVSGLGGGGLGLESCCLGLEGTGLGLGTSDLVNITTHLPVTTLHLQVVVTSQKLHFQLSLLDSMQKHFHDQYPINDKQTIFQINNVFLNIYSSAQLVSCELDFYKQEDANVLVRKVSELTICNTVVFHTFTNDTCNGYDTLQNQQNTGYTNRYRQY